MGNWKQEREFTQKLHVQRRLGTHGSLILFIIANTKPPKLHIICNYVDPKDGQAGPRIWEDVQATSAAVPYLYPFGGFIGGGFIANNPTIDAIVVTQSFFHKQK